MESRLNAIMWDLSTTTAGDYTLELNISYSKYKWFLDNHFNQQNNSMAVSDSMKLYIKEHLEKLLQEEHAKIKPDESETEIKIADIQFAYNNRQLIQLLQKRGTAINYHKYEEMREIE